MPQDERWSIKVLNGPHAGGQAILSGEKITIGSSPECDLVLTDPHVAPVHCTLSQREDYVLAEGVEGALLVDGKLADRGELRLGNVLTVGTTHLMAGPTGVAWPLVALPAILIIPGPKEEVKAAQEAARAAAVAQDEKRGGADEGEKRVTLLSRLLKWPILVGAAAVLLVLGVLIFAIVVRSSNKTDPLYSPRELKQNVLEARRDEASEARQLAEDLKKAFPNVYIEEFSENGRVRLLIYATGVEERDQIRELMVNRESIVPLDIINVQELDASGNDLAQMMNFSVRLQTDGRGNGVWKGYLPNHEAWAKLNRRLTQDLPMLRRSRLEVFFGSEAEVLIREIIKRNGLGRNFIDVEPEQSKIVIRGQITPSQQLLWTETMKDIETALSNEVPIVDKIVIASEQKVPEKTIFDSPIASVVVSSEPWVTLQNGQRLFPGAEIKSGYILKEITSNGLVLESPGGGVMTLPITQ